MNKSKRWEEFIKYRIPDGADFRTQDGNKVWEIEPVFAICKKDSNNRWHFVATAFFINRNGLFATAKHVITEEDRKTITPGLNGFWFPNNRECIIRPVVQLNLHEKADIAVGILAPVYKKDSKEPLTNKSMTLTLALPKIKTICSTFAYPKTTVDSSEQAQSVHLRTSWLFGRVEEYYPDGADKIFLTGKGFRTSHVVPFGASGGPVADYKGKVFGINSAGLNLPTSEEPISFISSIHDLLECKLHKIQLGTSGDIREEITVEELVQNRLITLHNYDTRKKVKKK